MRSKRMAIGDAYYDSSQHCWPGGPCTFPDIDADTDLIIEGNVGIGTITSQSPAPNGQQGNLDVNDVYLRSADQWMSEGGIPAGVIVMWSGSVVSIPDGWHLCNGTNGTPDLRNRFIVGAGSSYNPGNTGGENTHKLTIAELPSHSHSEVRESFTRGAQGVAPGFMSNPTTVQTGIEGGDQPHENRPPYYALCYIMKI